MDARIAALRRPRQWAATQPSVEQRMLSSAAMSRQLLKQQHRQREEAAQVLADSGQFELDSDSDAGSDSEGSAGPDGVPMRRMLLGAGAVGTGLAAAGMLGYGIMKRRAAEQDGDGDGDGGPTRDSDSTSLQPGSGSGTARQRFKIEGDAATALSAFVGTMRNILGENKELRDRFIDAFVAQYHLTPAMKGKPQAFDGKRSPPSEEQKSDAWRAYQEAGSPNVLVRDQQSWAAVKLSSMEDMVDRLRSTIKALNPGMSNDQADTELGDMLSLLQQTRPNVPGPTASGQLNAILPLVCFPPG